MNVKMADLLNNIDHQRFPVNPTEKDCLRQEKYKRAFKLLSKSKVRMLR